METKKDVAAALSTSGRVISWRRAVSRYRGTCCCARGLGTKSATSAVGVESANSAAIATGWGEKVGRVNTLQKKSCGFVTMVCAHVGLYVPVRYFVTYAFQRPPPHPPARSSYYSWEGVGDSASSHSLQLVAPPW